MTIPNQSLKEWFDVRQYDRDCSSEAKFTFTQDHLDQGQIANPDLVGQEYNLKNQFPFALRTARFVPVQGFMYYTVRKLTEFPWICQFQMKGEPNQILYVPQTYEPTVKFKARNSSKEYQVRCTDMIGPEQNESLSSQIHQFPETIIEDIQKCDENQLQKYEVKSIGWREFHNDGILEGLEFEMTNDQDSEKYGCLKDYPRQFQYSFEQIRHRVKKISVFYDNRCVTGLSFYDLAGYRVGQFVGKPKMKGASGEVYEKFIGLLPQEKIVGFKIQEVKNEDQDDLIGNIGFILCAPAQQCGNIRWSYSGQSVNHETAVRYGNMMGQLLDKNEAVKFVKENGALFPHDQWAAVSDKDDFICLGTSQPPGTLISKLGGANWASSPNVLEWRNVFLWKETKESREKIKESIVINEDVEKKVEYEKQVPENLFLSSIKVLKYETYKDPVLVREILCENNMIPCFDYGPSVAYFNGCIYYFKRIYRGFTNSVQMYKYNFDEDKESQIEGAIWMEKENVQSRFQFFEQPNSDKFESEQDWLNNNYVCRRKNDDAQDEGAGKRAIQIYCLGRVSQPVLDSAEVKWLSLHKLVVLPDLKKQLLKFYFFTQFCRTIVTIPIRQETVYLKKSEYRRDNPTRYHLDQMTDIAQIKIDLNGQETLVNYFMKHSQQTQVIVEVLGFDDEKQEKEIGNKIKDLISGGVFINGNHSEPTTQIERKYCTVQDAAFQGIMPRRFVQEIFEPEFTIDIEKRLFESPDGESMILYTNAGRQIFVASLKPNAQFKKVQELFGSLGYDPTPQEEKLKKLEDLVNGLKKDFDINHKKLEMLENKR